MKHASYHYYMQFKQNVWR